MVAWQLQVKRLLAPEVAHHVLRHLGVNEWVDESERIGASVQAVNFVIANANGG